MEAPPSPKAVVYSLDSPSFSPRWSNPSPIPAVSLGSIPVVPAVPVADVETKEEKTAVMSEVKLSEANSNSNSNSNDSVEMKDETVETQSGTMDASKPSDSNENGGNSGNSGNGEEPKPELAKEESEKSEKPVPAMVETVEPENHRIEIKLPGSSSNTPEAGKDSELPAEEETEEAEEAEEAEEVLIPYDISLLHQILSFLIQLADPTKCV